MADYHSRLVAKTPCELYRVRQSDFMIAVLSVPAAHEWFYRFRLLERETKDRFLMRLRSAQGAEQARRPASAPSRALQNFTQPAFDTTIRSRPGTAPQGASRDRTWDNQRMQRAASNPSTSHKALDLLD